MSGSIECPSLLKARTTTLLDRTPSAKHADVTSLSSKKGFVNMTPSPCKLQNYGLYNLSVFLIYSLSNSRLAITKGAVPFKSFVTFGTPT